MVGIRRSYEPAPNALVGAARRIHLHRSDEVQRQRIRSTQEWQRIAWSHYDEIGEIKYAFNYFAAVASRIRLYTGYQADVSNAPVAIGDVGDTIPRSLVTAARYELDKLSTGRGGQPNLIRALVLNLLVVGETYLVGVNGDSWAARSTSELRFEADDRIRLILSRYQGRATNSYLPPDAYVARIWKTHPEYSEDADSSLKGVQDQCSELLLLSRLIRSSTQSRLNAGILYVADELRFQRAADPDGITANPDLDPFEEELTLALTEPIGITDSPSEVVPMIVRGPAEFIDKGIQRIDLSRGFDEVIVKRHDQTLARVLNGLDLPKDLVTGLAHVRYANSVTIQEDMLKAHVEPLILLICEALTTVFLRPQLIARGYDQELVNRVQVWYDPAAVVTRADRSKDADTGYERMLVSGSAWRRAHGFSEADAPDASELVRRIALTGVVPPETTVDFLRLVAPDLVHAAEELADADPSKSMLPAVDNPVLVKDAHPVSAPPGPPPSSIPTTRGRPDAPIDYHEPKPGGILPPREPQQAAQVIEILRAISAGAAQPSADVRDRTRRLELALDVERRLRDMLFTHLNDTVLRALERAGARVVSKIRNDASLKSLVADVAIHEVFSKLSDVQRAALAFDERALVYDTLEKAKEGFISQIFVAQNMGWDALGLHGLNATVAWADDVEAAWRWTLAQLTTLAVACLHEPLRSGTYVDVGLVRTAAAIAGGEPGTLRRQGGAVLSTKALAETEWPFSTSRRWMYSLSQDSDGLHSAFDGTTFTVDRANSAFPGDSQHCRCDFLPIPLDDAPFTEVNGHSEVNSHATRT
jgi:hypothetical protein